ncbi:MAG: DUF2634 domain-containing protein [Lachnospiraceae bacterium]|nr:DUF2634 domain-containing protein [Lachnospiraceae bacterium]
MIPMINEQFLQNFTEAEFASKDYGLDISNSRINGTVNDLEALKQAIYIILNTERYEHIIYSWNHGVELNDLIGQPYSYVIPETERRVTEALMQDDRITGVGNFVFEKRKDTVHGIFKVSSIFGTFESEVDVNV